ncbi:MAG: pilX [Herminiimonas sp.]|jgi:type IV pilus assembly protein PilX|nr:pilX [Herminiimonas sp.]
MLINNTALCALGKTRARQDGAVLMLAIIVLVVMTLASLALVRSVDTSNLIVGNLAFQRAATHSGDAGIEAAVGWLESCRTGTNGCSIGTLNADDDGNGYSASGNAKDANGNYIHAPASGQSWDQYWNTSVLARPPRELSTDASGNTVSFIIDRLCDQAGGPSSGARCSASPLSTTATGNAEEAGEVQLNAPSQVYYRITARVAGPRNTVSYIQVMVAL